MVRPVRMATILLLVFAWFLTGCWDDSREPELYIADEELYICDDTVLTYVVPFSDGNMGNVFGLEETKVVSSDTSVATVDENGTVVAIATGTVTFTASYDGYNRSVSMKVLDKPPVSVEVTQDITLDRNGTAQLVATAIYVDGDERTVNVGADWNSSNATIATTTDLGVVTGLEEGNATITARCASAAVEGTSVVEVIDE